MRTIKNRNNNGRPCKSLTEKKRNKVTVKFATAEYYSLKSKAREAGMNLGEFIRVALEKSIVRQRLTPENYKAILGIVYLGNNVNQLAKRANQAGFAEVSTQIKELLPQLNDMIKMIDYDG